MSGIDQREEDLQRIRGFRLMDDDFMAKCFEDDIPCTELVLSIVLERSDLKVESVRTQYEIATQRSAGRVCDGRRGQAL